MKEDRTEPTNCYCEREPPKQKTPAGKSCVQFLPVDFMPSPATPLQGFLNRLQGKTATKRS